MKINYRNCQKVLIKNMTYWANVYVWNLDDLNSFFDNKAIDLMNYTDSFLANVHLLWMGRPRGHYQQMKIIHHNYYRWLCSQHILIIICKTVVNWEIIKLLIIILLSYWPTLWNNTRFSCTCTKIEIIKQSENIFSINVNNKVSQ